MLALAVASALAGLGTVLALAVPQRWRAGTAGGATATVGIAAIVAGLAAVSGTPMHAHLPWLLPLSGVRLALDPLSGWFVLATGAVAAVTGLFSIGYQRGHAGRAVCAVLPLFVWALLLVPCADSVSTLLLAWELMAGTSLVLVLSEQRQRPEVVSAAWWYATLTQAGFVAILLGLVLFAAHSGDESFSAMRSAHLSPVVRDTVFLLVLAGFGSKAGLVPLHVWLPRAHPEAPSHVSAMLSAAMVNLGCYGVIRVGFDLLHGGTRWWWLAVMGAGAASALYGILQAAVATDLKRLLAYSTVENMGLVFLGVGAAGLLRSAGAQVLAALALAAALLHVANHAAFKALLFCAAGSVLRATGTRGLDDLGGLRGRMPLTTVLFAVGALAASALPPSNGFVSEWLLLQSLVHGVSAGGVVTAVAMPAAVGVVALTAGLAVATFVKALGIGFLARPRSAGAAAATESPASMLAAMGLLAAGCLALAVVPALAGPGLSGAAGAAGLGTPEAPVSGGVTLRLAGIASSLSPLTVALALVLALAGTALAARLVAVRVRRRRAQPLWDCGAGPPTSRMQYTATSFAQPLARVFDRVLAPETDVDVTPYAESRYILERVSYRQRVPDGIEHRLYQPLLRAVRRLGRLGTVLANGSVHRYLGYGFLGVTGLLVVLAVLR